jgi:hypothetical protein
MRRLFCMLTKRSVPITNLKRTTFAAPAPLPASAARLNGEPVPKRHDAGNSSQFSAPSQPGRPQCFQCVVFLFSIYERFDSKETSANFSGTVVSSFVPCFRHFCSKVFLNCAVRRLLVYQNDSGGPHCNNLCVLFQLLGCDQDVKKCQSHPTVR